MKHTDVVEKAKNLLHLMCDKTPAEESDFISNEWFDIKDEFEGAGWMVETNTLGVDGVDTWSFIFREK